MNNFKLSILFVLQKNKTNNKRKCPIKCRITFLKSRKEFSTGIFVNQDYWNSGKQKAIPLSKENSILNNKLSLIYQQIDKAFLMLQILPNDFDVDDIYRKYKGEDSKEEITILGAYDLHNEKTKKLIGIDFNQLSWSRYVESRRKVALFISKFYNRKDVRLKEQKAINADQAVELKKEKQINKAFKKQVEKLRNQKRDQQLKHAMAGFFGLILGKVIN